MTASCYIPFPESKSTFSLPSVPEESSRFRLQEREQVGDLVAGQGVEQPLGAYSSASAAPNAGGALIVSVSGACTQKRR